MTTLVTTSYFHHFGDASYSHHFNDYLQLSLILWPPPNLIILVTSSNSIHFGKSLPLSSLKWQPSIQTLHMTIFHSLYTGNHLLLPTLWWLYPTPNTPPPINRLQQFRQPLPSYSLPSMFLPTTTSTRNQGYKTTKITMLLQKAYFYSYLYHNVYYKSRLFHYHNKWYPPQLLHYNHFTPIELQNLHF